MKTKLSLYLHIVSSIERLSAARINVLKRQRESEERGRVGDKYREEYEDPRDQEREREAEKDNRNV